jgi:signal transduction histidine kinase
MGEKYYLTDANGRQLGDGAYISTSPAPLSMQDARQLAIYEMIPSLATPLISVVCLLAAVLLFYAHKLKKPLAALTLAAQRIASSDLDFALDYDNRDEMGQLVQSFAVMRTTLADNFATMWRQIEERKQLNSAFAHDLRTPLTVLSGYAEMLQTSDAPDTRFAAATMHKQLCRMQRYIDSMSRIQRLEDAALTYVDVALQEFVTTLSSEAALLCSTASPQLTFVNQTTSAHMILAPETITHVCNNLLTNAMRYAVHNITIGCSERRDGFVLCVTDDGTGFSANALQRATQPYFTEAADRAEHFGLGLSICRLLCTQHGGDLSLANLTCGAEVTAFFKSP